MKCRLVQILAVAMLLGHTVSAPGYEWVMSLFKSAADEPAVLDTARLLGPAESRGEIPVDTLSKEVNTAIEKLDTAKQKLAITQQKLDTAKQLFNAKFVPYPYTNEEQAYSIVKKLLDIKERVVQSTHKDTNTLVTKMNKEIDDIVPNLRNAQENIEKDIDQDLAYFHQINNKIRKIKTSPLSAEDMQSIRDTCNNAGIDCSNIGTHLSTAQLEEKLKEVKNILHSRITNKQQIHDKIYKLLLDIRIKKFLQTMKHDTRDTQSMRNVIGISIAVCAIVTLCIVLLIAVHNKHRTNTGVRLFERV